MPQHRVDPECGEFLVTASGAGLATKFQAGKVLAYESHSDLARTPPEPRG